MRELTDDDRETLQCLCNFIDGYSKKSFARGLVAGVLVMTAGICIRNLIPETDITDAEQKFQKMFRKEEET